MTKEQRIQKENEAFAKFGTRRIFIPVHSGGYVGDPRVDNSPLKGKDMGYIPRRQQSALSRLTGGLKGNS